MFHLLAACLHDHCALIASCLHPLCTCLNCASGRPAAPARASAAAPSPCTHRRPEAPFASVCTSLHFFAHAQITKCFVSRCFEHPPSEARQTHPPSPQREKTDSATVYTRQNISTRPTNPLSADVSRSETRRCPPRRRLAVARHTFRRCFGKVGQSLGRRPNAPSSPWGAKLP